MWGTCAGAILLSQAVSNPKRGGQELLGGVSVTTTRNGWGSQVRHPSYTAFRRGARTEDFDFLLRAQVESFEAPLEVSGLRDADIPFMGIFIRAPVSITFFFFVSRPALCLGAFAQKVIAELLPAAYGPPIEVICRIPDSLLPHRTLDGGPSQTVVALRQGRHLLTTFHPELTGDDRFHEYFVRECVVASLAP